MIGMRGVVFIRHGLETSPWELADYEQRQKQEEHGGKANIRKAEQSATELTKAIWYELGEEGLRMDLSQIFPWK